MHLSTTLAVALFLVPSSAFAQARVDWVADTEGVGVAVDSLSRVVTVNSTYSQGGDLIVTSRDPDGTLRWQASHDQTDPTKWERAAWITTDGDDNVVACGTLMSGFSDPVTAASIVMKLDPAGNVLWRNVYESDFDGSWVARCLVGPDDAIYVLGLGAGPNGHVSKIKKFAPDGTAEWSWFDAAGIGAPLLLKWTPDDHLLVTGRGTVGSVNGFAKVDLTGATVWALGGVRSLTTGDAAGDSAGNTYLVNGEYVVNGGTVVTRLDPAGATLWTRTFAMAGTRVEVGSDDHAVVAGYPSTGSTGAAFLEVDPSGTLQWLNPNADQGRGLLLHAQLRLDASNDAYLAAGTLFEMAVCKVNDDGSSAWTATTSGGYATSIALGRTDASVFVVGGDTARLVDEGEPPRSVVLDDGDPAFVQNGPPWREVAHADATLGGAHATRGGAGVATVGWRIGAVVPGTYDVEVWRFDHPWGDLMAPDARYRVFHDGGPSPWIPVDLSAPGTGWLPLGRFTFGAATPNGVALSGRADGLLIADAVRLVPVPPAP